MKIYDVVKKLVGEIEPIGETNTDNERFENLKNMTDLVDRLLSDIDSVAWRNKNRHEYSRSRAGKYADEFQTKMGIEGISITRGYKDLDT